MSEYFTRVDGGGYLCRGQISRAEAIAETRKFAAQMRDKYVAICEHLDQDDDKLRVIVVKGSVLERPVRELHP